MGKRDVRRAGEGARTEEEREERQEKREGGRKGEEGEMIEEKKRTERVSQWEGRASKEQGRNCQAHPGFFPWCVLDQPWASASAPRGCSPGPWSARKASSVHLSVPLGPGSPLRSWPDHAGDLAQEAHVTGRVTEAGREKGCGTLG